MNREQKKKLNEREKKEKGRELPRKALIFLVAIGYVQIATASVLVKMIHLHIQIQISRSERFLKEKF